MERLSVPRPASVFRRSALRSPTARALVKSRPSQRLIAAQRAARALRPAGRFLAGETGAHEHGRYELRRSGQTVHLRHRGRDVAILNEIFAPGGRGCYEPPDEVADALAALGPLRVGDLGGNIGLFGLFALARWPVRELRSYEPDPANAALLRATIAANDAGGYWALVPAAVSNENTTASFRIGLFAESRLAADRVQATAGDGRRAITADDRQAIEVPVVDLFAQPPVDLLKIDIEGGEWPILQDARLAAHPARALVLEWHSRMCPAPDARAAAQAMLAAAGYAVVAAEPGETLANGLIWALRR
jgi:FkbM family methyltransferase